MMDPWQADQAPASISSNKVGSKQSMEFEDHFQPFAKLPDSDEYLASLEKKLQTVQRGSTTNSGSSLSSQEIIRSLEENHESCMMRLLTNSVQNLNGIGEDSEELKVNPLLKKLAPEKQALTVEELVNLVKADQLAVLVEGADDCKDEPESSAEKSAGAEPEGQA